MKALAIGRQALRRYRLALAAWALGLAALSVVTAAAWPAVRDGAGLEDLLDRMPAAVRALVGEEAITTPEGFLGSRFDTIVPLLVVILAVFRAANETAGAEQDGQLELLVAEPVSRAAVYLGKAAAVAAALAVIVGVTFATLWVGAAAVGMGIAGDRYLAAAVAVWLLGAAFAGATFALAGLSGRRGLTLGVATFTGAGSWVLHTFAPLVPGLEPWRVVSPFALAVGDNPLRHGLDREGAAMLAVLAAAGLVIGVVGFGRRDLGTR